MERLNNLKLKFLQRAFHSIDGLVIGLLLLVVDKKLQLGMSLEGLKGGSLSCVVLYLALCMRVCLFVCVSMPPVGTALLW